MSCLAFSFMSCQSSIDHKFQAYTIFDEFYFKDRTFLDFQKMNNVWYTEDEKKFICSRSFMIAENLIQSILKEDYQVSETNYYFFEKIYSNLRTYNVCFLGEKFLKNGGYPCVEIDKQTGIILRITIAGESIPNEIMSVVPALELKTWSNDEMILINFNERRICNLGIFQSNLPYEKTKLSLWIDEIKISYEFLAMNAFDLFADNDGEDLADYECNIALERLKDKNICEIWFSKDFRSYNSRALIFDLDTGQPLGYCLQE